jgi:ubiquinone/menaquinone biosynthesis C-methylase UbiE
MAERTRPADRDAFEAQWRERFEEFAELRDDDAGIAGWSPSGLDTRFRFFTRRWVTGAPGSLWVDVGCGAGTYSRWLHEHALRVVGLDYSQPTLAKARARLPHAIALAAADARLLPVRDGVADGVLCFGVLQAVSDSATIVRELARILAPGGELWIDALNRDALAARLTLARRRLQGKGQHLRYETAAQLGHALAEAGLCDIRCQWLPIAPSQLALAQPILDSETARICLDAVPWIGRLLSHSVVFCARKPGGASR